MQHHLVSKMITNHVEFDSNRKSMQHLLARKTREACASKIKNPKEAAKQRRKKENNEFRCLSNQLPIQIEIMDKLDKVSIIRLAVSYLKLKIVLSETKLLYPIANKKLDKFESNISLCLGGFMFILADDLTILYVSESISAVLGLSQVLIIGSSILEYIHGDDHREAVHYLTNRKLDDDDMIASFTLRFKSNLIKINTNLNSNCKSQKNVNNGWRLMQINGRKKRSKTSCSNLCFFGMAVDTNTSQILGEIPIKSNTLLIRLNLSFQIESIECFNKKYFTNGELSEELNGKSLFHLVHPSCLSSVVANLNDVVKKSHSSFSFQLAISTDCKQTFYTSNCMAYKLTSSTQTAANDSQYYAKIILINELFTN